MKKNLVITFGLSIVVLFTTGCKSQQSAYRQAYEQAVAQDKLLSEQEAKAETPTQTVTVTTPETTVTPTTTQETVDNSDVREIQGATSVVSGNPLKTYSVVVGSFVTQANAEGLKTRLQNNGYDARVLQTNETINNKTGWYRVIASSYEDKASAVQSRDALRSNYPGAWLLYRK